MKTIQSEAQNEDLRSVLERIVQDLQNSHAYDGNLSVERAFPPPGIPTETPADYPHIMVQEEKRTSLLGLIRYTSKEMIVSVKEGFYDIEEKSRKDMFVLLGPQSPETIIKKHLEDYARRNQVTEIVFKTFTLRGQILVTKVARYSFSVPKY
jgi:hypothetical protein